MKEQKITIIYDGKPDFDIDTQITGILEFEPLNFEWIGQGYSIITDERDISFRRTI